MTAVGEIDHHTGGLLREALDAPYAPRARIVVDLGGVTFIDSTALNIFIAAHRDLDDAGGRLRLAAASDSVMRTLAIVGVDTLIDCRATLAHALGD
ncbi:anti-anti-sigma factor [Streptomyces mangrovisoli]|uniref:Anti-sigma factor antagonist n=1 Tax=Streptomyces mangrovisoli TaxID=1428628 RepID=A0A1J4NVI7_9ACTN|nr:anti-anti-sigma factor [Streptomyces mangrovisoli]